MITDINPDRLTLAEKMGADIAINSAQVDLHAEVMRLTDGNGVERLVEASGASAMVNTCFTLLRKVSILSMNYSYKKSYILHFTFVEGN